MTLSSPRSVLILVLLGLAVFSGTWNFVILAPVLPEVAEDAGVSVTVAGQLVAISAVATLFFLVVLGPLADRYPRRVMMLGGLAAMAAAALGSALTSEYWVLVVLRVVSGVGDALVLPAAAAAVSDYFRGKDREVALNYLLIPMGVAAVIGLPAVVVITNASDWHVAFLVFGLFNVVGVLGIRWLLPRPVEERASGPGLREHYRESYRAIVGDRVVLLILIAAVLGSTVWNGMVTYAAAFFEEEVGADGAGLTGMFATLGVAYVAGGAVGAMLARRMPSRTIAIWSTLGVIAILVPVIVSSSFWPLTVILAAAFAASRAPGIAALNNMLLDLTPSAEATAISAYGVVVASGALLGAGVGGLALDFEGYLTMAAVFTGMAACSALILIFPVAEYGAVVVRSVDE